MTKLAALSTLRAFGLPEGLPRVLLASSVAVADFRFCFELALTYERCFSLGNRSSCSKMVLIESPVIAVPEFFRAMTMG